MVEPYDHLRVPADASVQRQDGGGPVRPGVYRVVGTDPEAVTLLRVVEDGRRVYAGAVVRVASEDVAALAPAGNPDAGLARVRQVPTNLRAHPLLSAAAIGALLVGGTLATTASGLPEDGGAILLGLGAVGLWVLLK